MNIRDYIKWRGDLTFQQDPFNIVDNLIFSYAIYTDLRGIVSDEPVTVQKASSLFFEINDEEECAKCKSFIAQAPFVLREMANSTRYQNLLIHHYINDIDADSAKQFSVAQFDIDANVTYVAFCGTDDTLIGWQEDFDMSYKVIPSQKLAVDYLNQNLLQSRKYYIGGHSKGGNLAAYASVKCDSNLQNQILHVYNNDGPGLSDRVYQKNEVERMMNRYTKIMPEESIIGMIFYEPSNDYFVKADDKLLMQHDALNWQVIGKEFEYVSQPSDISIMIRNMLNDFLQKTDDKQREEFVQELFDAFVRADIHNVSEFVERGLPVFYRLIKTIMADDYSYSEVTKELWASLVAASTQLAQQRIKEAQISAEKKVNDTKNSAEKMIDEAKNKADQLIDDAKQNAEKIIDDTKLNAERILDDTKEKANEFISKKMRLQRISLKKKVKE